MPRSRTTSKSKKEKSGPRIRSNHFSSGFCSTTDEEYEEVPLIDSEEDIDPESPDISNVEDNQEQEISFEVETGKCVPVKYTINNRFRHFVGFVSNKTDIRCEIKILRLYSNNFDWPQIDDVDTVTVENIVKILPDPNQDVEEKPLYFHVILRDII
ncbi:hypothetical protein JTB14_015987 [Gonioctena quinquepunctata]|nr:hypothetical protein JTB14_015987 [Gonioctena quinquepunctata]